jgi:phosphate transport system protein
MTVRMREALERDLREISAEFIRLISHTSEQLELAEKVLLEREVQHATRVSEIDVLVDALEIKLEQSCLRAIAQHQPVASDLRFLAAVLKSLSDLERIGDYCVHVAEDARLLANDPPLKRYINLGQMIGRLKTMLHACSLAFSERDSGKAKETSAMDLEIDDLYEQTQRELVTYMIEDPRTITKALALLRVGRALQRIGDHIENVSDRVQYWLTGKRQANDAPTEG